MGRPSKLTPAQWDEVGRRVLTEGVRDLAKEFRVDPSAISRRFPQQSQQGVKAVAQQLAAAQTALAALPPAQQATAVSLADKLRNISDSLASAAELGAKTAHRLQALANGEVAKIDDAQPLSSMESLKGVKVLTELANGASSIALNLLAANKDKLPAEDPADMVPVFNITTTDEQKSADV